MTIILDNGHGQNTTGKCSPDKSILEWQYTRKLTAAIASRLRAEGYDVRILVPETYDVFLAERVRRANKIYADSGKKAFLVSCHLNAAGNAAQWLNARGWSVFISNNASNNSKMLAGYLFDEAKARQLHTRAPFTNQKYWQQNLYITKNTNCPAVLTESLFMDNKQDVSFLLSDSGFNTIVDLHVEGIKKYIQSKK